MKKKKKVKTPSALDDIRLMQEFAKDAARPASIAQYQLWNDNLHGNNDSRFLGNVIIQAKGEALPINSENGNLMLPLLQVNLTELPFVPEALEGKAWMSIFFDYDSMLLGSHENGDNWCLRLYESIEELEAIEIPENKLPEKFKKWASFKLDWQLHQDLLDYRSDHFDVYPEEWQDILSRLSSPIPYRIYPRYYKDEKDNLIPSKKRFRGDNARYWNTKTTKIGGFPAYHQYDDGEKLPSHPKNFLIQVLRQSLWDIEYWPKGKKYFDLCDASSTYIGFIDRVWIMETQTS